MPHANNTSFREASASQNASTNIRREKTRKVTLLLAPQTKSEQRNERQLAFEQNRQNNSWRTPIDDKIHLQLQSNETNNIYLNANIKLKS